VLVVRGETKGKRGGLVEEGRGEERGGGAAKVRDIREKRGQGGRGWKKVGGEGGIGVGSVERRLGTGEGMRGGFR